MSGARFRYALAPVLLTRGWEVDALQAELGELNAGLARQQAQLDRLRAQADDTARAWNTANAGGAALSVERFVRMTAYLSELNRQQREQHAALALCEQERDALAARLARAQRAREAIEQHRDDARARFVRGRQSGDFAIADDQWNTLQARKMSNDR